MKLCGSCVASVRRLQYLSLVCLCHQKKAFPLRFWLPGHKLQYRTFIIIIIINNYLLYIMHHVVVVYSCIPTLQDYQTWVSVVHCAWHPLSHHYLSVLAIIIFFFFYPGREVSSSRACKIKGAYYAYFQLHDFKWDFIRETLLLHSSQEHKKPLIYYHFFFFFFKMSLQTSVNLKAHFLLIGCPLPGVPKTKT